VTRRRAGLKTRPQPALGRRVVTEAARRHCVHTHMIRTVTGPEWLFSMAKSHLKLVSPTTKNRTVTPTRPPNAELSSREYLTDASWAHRWGHRDATMVLLCYRHGFRAS
jgi:hypothetical protein